MPAYKDGKKWKSLFYFNGIKIQKTGFETKREALEYETEYKYKFKGSENMLLSSLVELYLDDIKIQLKLKTIIRKKSSINKYILPFFKNYRISEITVKVINDFNKMLINSGKLKGSSINKINSDIRAILLYGKKYHNINCIDFEPIVAKNIVETEKNVITEDEFNKIIESEISEKYKCIYQILFWTGIRQGELLALKFGDIDFKNKKMKINKTLTRYKKEDHVSTPKTPKSNRTILLNDITIKAIEKLKEINYYNSDNDYIVLSNANTIYSRLKTIEKKFNFKNFSIHTFRHSHATYLFSKGVNILLISKRLGHSNVSTTLNTYTHILDNMETQLIQALEK